MCFYVLPLLQLDINIAKGCFLPPAYFSKVFVVPRGFFFPFNFLPTQGPRLWYSALDTVQNCFWVCAHPFKGGLKHIPEQSFLFAVGGRKAGGWCLILCLLPLSCSGLALVSLPTWTAYWAVLESYHHMGPVWEVLYHCFLVSRFAYEMHASLSLYPFPPW